MKDDQGPDKSIPRGMDLSPRYLISLERLLGPKCTCVSRWVTWGKEIPPIECKRQIIHCRKILLQGGLKEKFNGVKYTDLIGLIQ